MKHFDYNDEYVDIKLPKKVYTIIETAVSDLFIKLQISSYPIDPFDIIRKLGFILRKYSELSLYEQIRLRSKDLDATSCFDPELQTYVICYDDTKYIRRIRFTLMHEVGHIILGHKEESELAKRMANYFAAYSLAPSPIIGAYDCQAASELAELFVVTDECAFYSFKRYLNWSEFGGRIRVYEEALLSLFEQSITFEEGGNVS